MAHGHSRDTAVRELQTRCSAGMEGRYKGIGHLSGHVPALGLSEPPPVGACPRLAGLAQA